MVTGSPTVATRQRRPTHTGRHWTATTVRTAQGRPDLNGSHADRPGGVGGLGGGADGDREVGGRYGGEQGAAAELWHRMSSLD